MTTSADQDRDTMPTIQLNPSRASSLLQNLTHINSRISSTVSSLSKSPHHSVRLVAVSKLKPASDILALHQPPPQNLSTDTSSLDPSSGPPSTSPPPSSESHGHMHFGENYVQELLEKSSLLPQTVKWHFIGSLQSNKCVQLARDVSSLWCVASVDSQKKATLLNKGRGERNDRLKEKFGEWRKEMGRSGMEEKLRVFIQVNTSGEESKSGLEPLTSTTSPETSDLLSLARYISSPTDCPNLHLQGLMTIGAIARSKASTPETENEDFTALRSTRDRLAELLDMSDGDKDELELSMGMSEDFEAAIRAGSSEVRVGSTIFGERPARKDAKVVEDKEKQ